MSKKKKSQEDYGGLTDGRSLIRDTLPLYLRGKKKITTRERHRRRCVELMGLDRKIYLGKYYPWSYKNFIPTLVLQGWYDVKYAKKKYIKQFGPDALKYVKFIKGREALERNFYIGHSLYINGHWEVIRNKTFYPIDVKRAHKYQTYKVKLSQNSLSLKNNLKSPQKESKFLEEQRYIQHERKYTGETTVKERLELQTIQKTKPKGKKGVYEIPE